VHRFTEEDLDNCWQYYKSYLIDILNGDYNLDDAREDLLGLINSKFDRRMKQNNTASLYEELSRMHVLNESMDMGAPIMMREDKATNRIDPATKKNINRELHELMKPTYFAEIPLDDIFAVLEKNGVVPLQEDGTKWSGMLLGDDSHAYIELGMKSTEQDVHGLPAYTPVINTTLALSWHKMNSGKSEVLAYLG
jgi:hypothetical protein